MEVGEKYGEWTVLEVDTGDRDKCLCQCSCGTTKLVRKCHLKSGTSKCCGCKTRLVDLTGQRFGMWVVLERAPTRNHQTMWRCRCDCGTERDVYARVLKSGESTSCGCWKSADLTGKRFGKWTVLKKGFRIRPNMHFCSTYLCVCDCGTKRYVDANSLIQKTSRSCGCVSSKANEYIANYLSKRHINFKSEYSFDDLFGISYLPLRFDFAIMNEEGRLLCLIEYQGRQHYIDEEFGRAQRERTDQQKRDYCKENHLKLYEIKYTCNLKKTLDKIISNELHVDPVPSAA